MDRRRILKLLGYSGVAVGLAACGVGTTQGTPIPSSGSTPGGSFVGTDCTTIPEETAGPYPGDGSNGPDILNQSGVVRQDIRSSFGTSTTVATGIPLLIRIQIQDLANSCVR